MYNKSNENNQRYKKTTCKICILNVLLEQTSPGRLVFNGVSFSVLLPSEGNKKIIRYP